MKNGEQKLVIYWDSKRIISWIAAILLVPTFLIFLFSVSLKTTVSNSDYYKNKFQQADVYNRLIKEGIPSIITESEIFDQAVKNPFVKYLIVYTIQESIDPLWLETITNRLIENIIGFFSKPSQSITLDLQDSDKFLSRVDDGLAIVGEMIPACQPTTNLLNLPSTCQGSNANLDQIKTDISKARTELNQINLQSLSIGKEVNKSFAFIGGIHDFIRNIKTAMWVSLFILIVLMAVIIITQFRNLSGLAKTLTIPLIVASIIGLIIGWLMKLPVESSLKLLDFGLPPALQVIIIDALKATILGIFSRIFLIAWVVIGISGLFYLLVVLNQKYNLLKGKNG